MRAKRCLLAIVFLCTASLSCGSDRTEPVSEVIARETPTQAPTPTNEQRAVQQKTWAASMDGGNRAAREMMSTDVTPKQIEAMEADLKARRQRVMDRRMEQAAKTASPEEIEELRKHLQNQVDNPPELKGPPRGDRPWLYKNQLTPTP